MTRPRAPIPGHPRPRRASLGALLLWAVFALGLVGMMMAAGFLIGG